MGLRVCTIANHQMRLSMCIFPSAASVTAYPWMRARVKMHAVFADRGFTEARRCSGYTDHGKHSHESKMGRFLGALIGMPCVGLHGPGHECHQHNSPARPNNAQSAAKSSITHCGKRFHTIKIEFNRLASGKTVCGMLARARHKLTDALLSRYKLCGAGAHRSG